MFTKLCLVAENSQLLVLDTTFSPFQNLDLLLKKLHQVVEKHHDTDVLETCAKTLEYLCTEGNAIYTRCDVQRSTLVDAIVNKYKEAMDEWNCLIEGVSRPGIYVLYFMDMKLSENFLDK